MNFLAHIYLSQGHEKLMVGNFIGDFVKGNQLESFEEEIKIGVNLHRAIDEYTDTHEIVKLSKGKLREKYRHYSGVIVDVYYDHFLAKNWDTYHQIPLLQFTEQTYQQLLKYNFILPAGAQRMLPYMRDGNWLFNYSKIEGIHQALSGMARRTKFNSKMEQSSEDLRIHYSEFEAEFTSFFKDLTSFSSDWIKREFS